MKISLFRKSCISIEKAKNQIKGKGAYTEVSSPFGEVYSSFKRGREEIIYIADLENDSQHRIRYEHWFKANRF